MKYSADLSVIEWLRPAISATINGPVLRVKDVLPDEFTTYTALLPAVGIIEDFPFNKVNLNDSSIAQLNINAAIWQHYNTHDLCYTAEYQPTRFIELASRFGLAYDLSMIKILEWRKRGFAINNELTANSLSVLLKYLAADDQLFLYVKDYWRWAAASYSLPTAEEVVYQVSAGEFITFLTQAFFDATLYLFPHDRSWCLTNLEDGPCPVIGTSAEIGAYIASQTFIETLQLTSDVVL